MSERNKTIGMLGELLYQAARASVAKGAQYDEGENIKTDARAAWAGIAETIIDYVDQRTIPEEKKE